MTNRVSPLCYSGSCLGDQTARCVLRSYCQLERACVPFPSFMPHLFFFFFTYFCCLGLHHAELAPIGSVHRELGLRKYESESHSAMSDSLRPQGLYIPWNSPGQNAGVVTIPSSRGSSQPSRGIFPTQGSNLGLLHCRQTPYCLSHQGSPKS